MPWPRNWTGRSRRWSGTAWRWRAGEEVLVVCNPATEELGALMRIVAQGEGAEATLAVIAERDSHAAEPPRAGRRGDARRRRGDRADDPVALPHRRPQGGQRGRRADRHDAGRHRGDAGPGDGRRHGRAAPPRRGVCAALDGGSEARITCANGSDLRLGLEGRTAIADAGDLSARGAFGNLPCGEGFIAPLEGTGEGTLVVDGSIAGVGQVDEPVAADGPRRPPDRRDRRRRRARCWSCSPPTAPTAPTSPSSGSAPTKRRSSPATSSRTRRSSAPRTSPSAPRRRSAARSRSRSTSTA